MKHIFANRYFFILFLISTLLEAVPFNLNIPASRNLNGVVRNIAEMSVGRNTFYFVTISVNVGGNERTVLAKLDDQGRYISSTPVDIRRESDGRTQVSAVKVVENDSLIATGNHLYLAAFQDATVGRERLPRDSYILKYNANLQKIWAHRIQSPNRYYAVEGISVAGSGENTRVIAVGWSVARRARYTPDVENASPILVTGYPDKKAFVEEISVSRTARSISVPQNDFWRTHYPTGRHSQWQDRNPTKLEGLAVGSSRSILVVGTQYEAYTAGRSAQVYVSGPSGIALSFIPGTGNQRGQFATTHTGSINRYLVPRTSFHLAQSFRFTHEREDYEGYVLGGMRGFYSYAEAIATTTNTEQWDRRWTAQIVPNDVYLTGFAYLPGASTVTAIGAGRTMRFPRTLQMDNWKAKTRTLNLRNGNIVRTVPFSEGLLGGESAFGCLFDGLARADGHFFFVGQLQNQRTWGFEVDSNLRRVRRR